MAQRRILSLWFLRLAAERVLRLEPELADLPLAVVAEARGALVLASLSAVAGEAGLRRGMALGDARAIVPDLISRPEDGPREAAFLQALRRWAGRFSPWVSGEGCEGLLLDVTGCAHLFGGEAELMRTVGVEAAALGLSLQPGLADTPGAAWAVARFAGAPDAQDFAGDAIDNEARATRSRARKRRWERGGAPPAVPAAVGGVARIVPPGATRAHISPLPVAALRIGGDLVTALHGLGLRRIGDVVILPRAQLARRLGPEVVLRLDQALGLVREPVSPARVPPVFALRLTFPEPVGLETDILAGLDRLLPPLCARLRAAGQGARRVQVMLFRSDGDTEIREAGLARPGHDPATIRGLLALRLEGIDAGFGFDVLRVAAVAAEPLPKQEHRGQLVISGRDGHDPAGGEGRAFADLLGRIGARMGLEALTRLHPADSHIPEKGSMVLAAAFSRPAQAWPRPAMPRPLTLFPPEPVTPKDAAVPPRAFVWRRRLHRRSRAAGPERIAPEWWLDDPRWRSGPRDYWRVETEEGARIWLYEIRNADAVHAWFIQGRFA